MKTRKSDWTHYGVTAILSCLAFLCLATSGVVAGGAGACGNAPAPEARQVKVITKRDGGVTRFFVENNEWCEVTMTFEVDLVNLNASVEFPATATFPPHRVTEAFALAPASTGGRWEYSYTNYYKLGSQSAAHDDSCVYRLPYEPGATFKVSQGYNGKFSHTGPSRYAIDWEMPEGTPVCAARGGLVVQARDESETGGESVKYDPCNNYVLVRHNDGTLGQYCHLQKGGCLVKPGQSVRAGEVIARSGSTGFSSGPHLHFCVYKTRDGRERESIPVHFRTATDEAITLVTGCSYRAPELQTASFRCPGAGSLSIASMAR